MELQPHPMAECWPTISDELMQELVEDIAARGVLEPIVLHEGKILDGLHRYSAAMQAGVECPSVEYDGTSPADFVISKNHHRRHISRLERATAIRAVRELERGERLTHREAAEEADVSVSTARRAETQRQVEQGLEPSAPSMGPQSEPQTAARIDPEGEGNQPSPPPPDRNPELQPAATSDRGGEDNRASDPGPPRPSGNQLLMQELETLRQDVQFYQANASSDASEQKKLFDSQVATISSQRYMIQEWQSKHEQAVTRIDNLEKERDRLRQECADLRAQLGESQGAIPRLIH